MNSIPRPNSAVNPILKFRDLNDGDARTIARADRLAMTVAEHVQAAENRWGMEYQREAVRYGGVGWVEVVMPADDPQAGPWVHLLPAGKRAVTLTDGDGDTLTVDMPVYLVRAAAPHYGAPDWRESENMREWLILEDDDHRGIMTEGVL